MVRTSIGEEAPQEERDSRPLLRLPHESPVLSGERRIYFADNEEDDTAPSTAEMAEVHYIIISPRTPLKDLTRAARSVLEK